MGARTPDRPQRAGGGADRLAVALLDQLTADVELAARERALGRLGDEAKLRRGEPGGSPEDGRSGERLRAALDAAGIDAERAGRIGERVAEDAVLRLQLRTASVGTLVRALRQCDHWAPRIDAGARYEVRELESARARLQLVSDAPPDARDCALHVGALLGMLRAVGVVAGGAEQRAASGARVTHEACRARGDAACTFAVRWDESQLARSYVRVAASAVGTGIVLAAGLAAGLPVAALVGAGVGCAALAAAWAAQGGGGPAVPEARDGAAELAALEQRIAERMDALAKLEATAAREARPAAARGEQDVAALGSALARLERETQLLARALSERKAELTAGGDDAFETVESRLARLCDRVASVVDIVGELPELSEREDVAALLEAVVGAAQRAHPNGPTIELDIATDLPFVRVDANSVEHAIDQLLRNAIEAAGSDGCVAVSARRREGGAEIAIEDDGDGIDPEAVERTLDPFFDARAGVDTTFGLPVAARIVERHGGALALHGEPGRGTRASFMLPSDGG